MRLWDGAAGQSPSPWGWRRGRRVRPGARPAEGASGPPPGLPGGQPGAEPRLRARPACRAFTQSEWISRGRVRGHHVSCFLSQLRGRRAQRRSIAVAFREHSPSRPSRPSARRPRHNSLTGRFRAAKACPGPPPRPSPQPRPRPPRRPAAPPWHHSAQPRRRSLWSQAGEAAGASERVWLWGCCGSGRGERRKTRRGASAAAAARAPGRACRGAPAAPGAHARARPRTCPGDPERPAEPPCLLLAGRLRVSTTRSLLSGSFRRRARRAAQTRLFRTRATVSEGWGFRVLERSCKGLGFIYSKGNRVVVGIKAFLLRLDSFSTQSLLNTRLNFGVDTNKQTKCCGVGTL